MGTVFEKPLQPPIPVLIRSAYGKREARTALIAPDYTIQVVNGSYVIGLPAFRTRNIHSPLLVSLLKAQHQSDSEQTNTQCNGTPIVNGCPEVGRGVMEEAGAVGSNIGEAVMICMVDVISAVNGKLFYPIREPDISKHIIR